MRGLPPSCLATAVLIALLVILPTSPVLDRPAAGGEASAPVGPPVGPRPSAAPAPVAVVPTTNLTPASPDPAGALGSQALAAAQAAGIDPRVVSIPHPSATPAQVAELRATGAVHPLENGAPAPMGLAYYGESAGPGGSLEPTILNTTSLEGSVSFNATGIQVDDLFQSSPDGYSIQLNAILTGVTLFGRGSYEFWAQNFIEYYSSAHVLVLISNVWNFSGGGLPTQTFYNHGPDGTSSYSSLGFYYAEVQVDRAVLYPFNLTFYLNSTVADGRDAVDFTDRIVSQAHPLDDLVDPFDFVIFNSLAHGGTPLDVPSNFTANGHALNREGTPYDFELIVGGPGAGSQATLDAADATFGLSYWTGSGYAAVPAAWSAGSETAETSTGAYVGWSNASSNAPAPGLGAYGTLSTGPSLLNGLWNMTGPEGVDPVLLNVSPANAFNVVSIASGWATNFSSATPAVMPGVFGDALELAPGTYTVLSELSGYRPVTSTVVVGGPTELNVSLVSDPEVGIYTPLWAFTNAEIAALATAGSGTPTDPFVLENDQPAPIGSVFGVYNFYGFPAYPAVFFRGTNATTLFEDPPAFATATSLYDGTGRALPTTNDLQYWFDNVSHVAILNATNISGWFAAQTYYPIVHDTFSVIFYESSDNLIANDTFASEGQGLLLFSGGSLFAGPLNVGGGSNTVWGNRFENVRPPEPAGTVLPESDGLGMEIAESNDTIYNNFVTTPTTAWLLPLNLYSGTSESFTDRFNISTESASAVNLAPGFPDDPLTGSIVGGPVQGGNFWWDYGLTSNPYNGADNPTGDLPYEERAATILPRYYPGYYHATYIYPGGDSAPLGTLYSVLFAETGLTAGARWYVNLSTGLSLNGTGSTLLAIFANTSFTYTATTSATGLIAAHGAVTVNGSAVTVPVHFYPRPVNTFYFNEVGLPSALMSRVGWRLWVDGAVHGGPGAGEIAVALPNGTYGWIAIGPPGYSAVPSAPLVAVNGTTVNVRFHRAPTYGLTFERYGLPVGQEWCVEISPVAPVGNATYPAERSCTTRFDLGFPGLPGPRTYWYDIVSPLVGQNLTIHAHGVVSYGPSGSAAAPGVVVVRFAYRYLVTFNETGLPTGGVWSVTIDGVTRTNSTGDPIVFALTNGTWGFRLGVVRGYGSSAMPRPLHVDGGPSAVVVVYSQRIAL
jgi:thermopsin